MNENKYAAGSEVSVGRSMESIRKEMKRLGASEFAPVESVDQGVMGVAGRVGGTPIRITVPLPDARGLTERQHAAEERRLWRCILYLVKSVRVLSEDGAFESRQMLLPYVVTPGGSTVWERARAQLESGADVGHVSLLGLPPASGPRVDGHEQ